MKKLILIFVLMPVILFSQTQDTLKLTLSWCEVPNASYNLNWCVSDYLNPLTAPVWANEIPIPLGVTKYKFEYVKPSHLWLGGFQIFFMVESVVGGVESVPSNIFVANFPFKADLARVPGKSEVNINDQAFWVDFYNHAYGRVFNYVKVDSNSQSGLILGVE